MTVQFSAHCSDRELSASLLACGQGDTDGNGRLSCSEIAVLMSKAQDSYPQLKEHSLYFDCHDAATSGAQAEGWLPAWLQVCWSLPPGLATPESCSQKLMLMFRLHFILIDLVHGLPRASTAICHQHALLLRVCVPLLHLEPRGSADQSNWCRLQVMPTSIRPARRRKHEKLPHSYAEAHLQPCHSRQQSSYSWNEFKSPLFWL